MSTLGNVLPKYIMHPNLNGVLRSRSKNKITLHMKFWDFFKGPSVIECGLAAVIQLQMLQNIKYISTENHITMQFFLSSPWTPPSRLSICDTTNLKISSTFWFCFADVSIKTAFISSANFLPCSWDTRRSTWRSVLFPTRTKVVDKSSSFWLLDHVIYL